MWTYDMLSQWGSTVSMSYIGYMYEKEKYIYALYNSNHKIVNDNVVEM